MNTKLNTTKFIERISFVSVLRVLFSDLFSKIILLFRHPSKIFSANSSNVNYLFGLSIH